MGAVLLLFARVGHGQGGQQLLGVRVLRVLHNLVGIAVLHDLALMHHHDAVGKHIDHRQIMGDEHDSIVKFLLQILEKLEYLRLDRNVKRSRFPPAVA